MIIDLDCTRIIRSILRAYLSRIMFLHHNLVTFTYVRTPAEDVKEIENLSKLLITPGEDCKIINIIF
jgi:hypothetical protein